MLQTFWHRFANCNPFNKNRSAQQEEVQSPTLETIQASLHEEFRGMRKILRKQSLVIEALRTKLDTFSHTSRSGGSNEELMQLASAFFHLGQSLGDQAIISPQRREAVSLFWLQLEQLLDQENIEIIREQGVLFDSRLHRAVLAHEPGAHKSVVVEVLEPGFIEHGKVRKAAKVILGPEKDEQKILEENSL